MFNELYYLQAMDVRLLKTTIHCILLRICATKQPIVLRLSPPPRKKT